MITTIMKVFSKGQSKHFLSTVFTFRSAHCVSQVRLFRTKSKTVIDKLNEKVIKNDSEIETFFVKYFKGISREDLHYLSNICISHIKANLDLLHKFHIERGAIEQNLYVFKMDTDILNTKLSLLERLKLKDLSHGLPFLKLANKRLIKLASDIKDNSETAFQGHKFYYLSDTLEVDPLTLANSTAGKLFVYTMPLEDLRVKLNALLEFGVQPDDILNDLWILRYKTHTLKKRFKIMSDEGKTKIMPWMARCQNSALKRSIQLEKTTMEIFGDKNSSLYYLAERLECSFEVIRLMTTKIPTIPRMRASKTKAVIDYLLSQGFTKNDIVQVPRIFANSLKTVQKRMELLQAADVKPSNLNILCKTRNDWMKFVNRLPKKPSPEPNK